MNKKKNGNMKDMKKKKKNGYGMKKDLNEMNKKKKKMEMI